LAALAPLKRVATERNSAGEVISTSGSIAKKKKWSIRCVAVDGRVRRVVTIASEFTLREVGSSCVCWTGDARLLQRIGRAVAVRRKNGGASVR